jgi:hypothetical protein
MQLLVGYVVKLLEILVLGEAVPCGMWVGLRMLEN